MTLDAAEVVARAVLYEGYLLYPYYPSSTKNRHRFQFGGLYPKSYVEANPGADRHTVYSDLLVRGPGMARLRVSFRGLQVLSEDTARDDAEERKLDFEVMPLEELARQPCEALGKFGDGDGEIFVRARASASELGGGLYRVRLTAANESDSARADRDLRRSLLSAHFLCGLTGGRFVSQIDPPQELAEESSRNRFEGLFPVLVGDESRSDCLLASPIILYDHPKIAPESRGDLFDGLEIDEILSLRIRTLTDAEKALIRAAGPRAAALLDRTESLTDEELLGLHGGRRGEETGLRPGDRVRLRPHGKRDIFDLELAGKSAVVESVERTLEDDCLVAVTLDEDPGRDLGKMGIPGHRFFFRPDEMEKLCG